MITDSDWLEYQTIRNGNETAVISEESMLTYSQLNDCVNSTAGKLIESGISEKQYVPVLTGHNLEFIVAVYALWRVGAVPIPLSTRLNKHEIDNIVSELSAGCFVSDSTCEYSNSDVKLIEPGIDEIVDFKLIDSVEFQPDNEALVLFTSGSTGKPKGVVHRFNSLYKSFIGTTDFDNYERKDRILASLPLYHIGGFSTITRACLAGAQLVLPAGTDYLSTAEAMSKFDPTIISLVPTNLERMLRNNIPPNKSLRSLYLGGGPSSHRLVGEAIEKGYPVIKVYGSTETCSMVSAIRVTDPSEYGTSGRTLKGSEVNIEENSKTEPNEQQEGEIVISSESLFKCYFNDRILTESSLRKGRYYTGDYGYLDETGLLNVLSRRTDLIVSGGENINPVEVEKALMRLAGISDCYVTGITDEEWGQLVVAFIVPVVLNSADVDKIIKELKSQIASYKIPKRFIVLDEIHRDSMGKIRRNELLSHFNDES